MLHIILDPDTQTTSSPLPADILSGHDLTGKTVLDVADDFTFLMKAVDWATLTIVDDLTPLWNALRAERDRLLAASDKYMIVDYPITEAKRGEWEIYRQTLRDLPESTTDPANPVWPTPPEMP